MQRNTKINRFLALLLSLMMLTALLPVAGFTESGLIDIQEKVMEQPIEGDIPQDIPVEPDAGDESVSDDTEETSLQDEPPDATAEDTLKYEADTARKQPEETIEALIATYGFAYVAATQAAMVYGGPELDSPVFHIAQEGAVLLTIEYENGSAKVCFLTESSEMIVGYVAANTIAVTPLADEEVDAMAGSQWCELIWTDYGDLYVFVIQGEYPGVALEESAAEAMPENPVYEPIPEPVEEPASEPPQEVEIPDDAAATETPMNEPVVEPTEESLPIEDDENENTFQEEPIEPLEAEEPVQGALTAAVGDYVSVTKNTRVFLGLDETATDDYTGDLSQGVFVGDATVQVMDVAQDSLGRYWHKVRYLYGDDYADGTLKWTEEGELYVLASETGDTTEQELSVTDYAFSSLPSLGIMRLLVTTPMNGFALKEINAPISSLTAGLTGIYGSSGHDNEYRQIATLPGHGTIYATPHYLDGYTVYCLEHTMPGPGQSISGGGNHPTGPYVIVDMDAYFNTPGASSIVYSAATLHAIGWVLRHTYPFMALDRSDSDNLIWTRVAGQFAIREVVKQMEGSQYVRSYWDMDNFYAASGQAPAVYLEYARWLAANGIAHGRITGNITITGRSTTYANGIFTGVATLSTDADLIRVRRSVGSVSGHTAGQDGTYYYLNSGDTITVSSASNPFSIVAESVNSDAEEASFLVGVPSASIQKVLIPAYGASYKLKSATVLFEIPYGSISVTKKDAKSGVVLPGATFELLNSAGTVVQTLTTDSDGMVKFIDLLPGAYSVREKSAPSGYYIAASDTQNVTVTAGVVTSATFTNQHVTIRLKLYKRDAEEYDGENPNASANANPTTTLPEPADISSPATRGDGVLTGAEFQVLAGEDITDRQGNVVYPKGTVVIASLKTTGEDVSIITEELWPGLYEIVELTPPLGYQASDTSIFVDARNAATQSQVAVVTYEGLVTNTILYGALTIAKFLGDNQEHTGAGIIEAPEKDAEFEVYLKSAGSYEDARDVERDYLITDRYGRATTKALPYGVYLLRQVVGAEGHALMLPIEFMIDGTEDLQDPPTLILNNQALRYRLRIVKTDAETGNTVALVGTSFQLKDSDGNIVKQSIRYPVPTEIDTFLTDENGEVTLPETVAWGHYFIEEVQSPEGYLICTEPLSVFVGHIGDATDEVHEIAVEFVNEPIKGTIVLDKYGNQLVGFEPATDAYGNEYQRPVYQEKYLEGAVFEVRATEDIVGKEGTVWYSAGDLVDTITTTASGGGRSKELPLGKYYLVETDAPAGYVYENTTYEADLVFADNMTARVETKVEAYNEYLPAEIMLMKEKEEPQVHNHPDGVRQVIVVAPGEGFVFGLYNAADIYYSGGMLMADTLVATGTTDANGLLTISGHYPHGQYYFRELSAPQGWKLNPERFPITLDPAKKAEDAAVIRTRLPDAVLNELIYTPITLTKTDITGETPLPGAVIEVKTEGGDIIYRATTDEHGQIPDIPVTPGTYTFHEVFAPEEYSLSAATLTFTVDESGNVTGDTVIRDDYTRFALLKLGENNEPLAGVEFTLAKDDGTLQISALTDENGLVTFEKVPYGSYRIVETTPLPGYMKNNTEVQIAVDGYFINPSEPVATVVNQRLRVNGIKVDTSGAYIPGVEFSLINPTTGEVVETATSNDCGEFVFSNFEYGDWIIRETKVPEGYSQMEDVALHVDESWTEPYSFTCVNIPNTYAFVKIDHEENPLAGVKFALEDQEGNVLRELISDEDGVVRVMDLAPSVYVIREIETLEGFIFTEETIEVVIDENYVPPEGKDIYHLVNYPGIQTGFEHTMTPVMWAGAALVLAAAALAVAHVVKSRKQKVRRNRRKPGRTK